MNKSILKIAAIILSVLALVTIIGSSMMVFLGRLEPATFKTWTWIASIIWFVTSPMWMINDKKASQKS